MKMSDTYTRTNGDRRITRRCSADLKVYLYGGLWLHHGTARDISRGGVFVTTDWPGLTYGTRLDLMFVQKDPKIIRIRRHSAIVIRKSGDGLGLKFCWSPHLGRLGNAGVYPMDMREGK
jgi:hypothetical protein